MLRKFFLFLLCCLFALCVTGLCLIILFPRERISSWVATMIETRIPGYDCSIEDIRYVHPLKIRLYRVIIANDYQGIAIPIDSLLLSFPTSYPVMQIGVSGVVFGGNVSADISFENLKKRGKIDTDNLEVSQIYLEEMDMIERALGRSLQGILSYSGRMSVEPGKLNMLRLTGNVRIRNFTTQLRQPIFSQDELSFKDVKADLSLSSSVLQLSDGQAIGSFMDGDFSGKMKMTAFWRKSPLDFKGNLTPQPELLEDNPNYSEAFDLYFQKYNTRSIPYRISGTLADPGISFSDWPLLDTEQTN